LKDFRIRAVSFGLHRLDSVVVDYGSSGIADSLFIAHRYFSLIWCADDITNHQFVRKSFIIYFLRFLIGLQSSNVTCIKNRLLFIRIIGTSEKKIILGLMIATGFLSMWIANTATAIMMLPIGISVMEHFGGKQPFSKI